MGFSRSNESATLSGIVRETAYGSGKRRLAVAYDVNSASPIQIASAVGEECELIWIVDSSCHLGEMAGVLVRVGPVIDIAGLTTEQAVDRVSDARPEGIVSFSDSQLRIASALADGLGLRYNRPEVTELFLDKYSQRLALSAGGCATPKVTVLTPGISFEELVSIGDVAFPAVLKPRSGSGSRNTYDVPSAIALCALMRTEALFESNGGEAYVLEEYIPDPTRRRDGVGDYVSVESVVVDGETHHLAVTGKFPLAAPYRETGNFMPCLLKQPELEEVRELAAKAVAALGVRWGCLHVEVKLTPVGPVVIEVNARVGGGGIDSIYRGLHGRSLIHVAAQVALGVDIELGQASRTGEVGYEMYIQPPRNATALVEIAGLDRVSILPGIAQLSVRRQRGDRLDWRDGSQGYVLSVRGSVPDHGELFQLRAQIEQLLSICYEYGERPEQRAR